VPAPVVRNRRRVRLPGPLLRIRCMSLSPPFVGLHPGGRGV